MPALGFTLPSPLQRDIEVIRLLDNDTGEGGVLGNSSRAGAGNGSGLVSGSVVEAAGAGMEDGEMWVEASQEALYYVLPAVLGCGVLLGVVSVLVLARGVRTSRDSYLLGLLVCSTLLLGCGAALKLQDYIPHNATYQQAYGYLKCVHDWLWYSALWTLVILALERGLALSKRRTRALCSAAQAGVVTGLVLCVCLLSALPQFWEYEVTETFDYGTNTSLVMAQLSRAAASPEYAVMYFWYRVAVTVLLPYPALVAAVVLLVQGLRAPGSRAPGSKHTPSAEVLQRRVREERHMTRLLVVLVLLYVVCSSPLTLASLLQGAAPHWAWPRHQLTTGLLPILQLIFYFYYATLFCLLLTYSDRFRRALLRTCCCCCVLRGCREHPDPEQHQPLKPRKPR